MLCWLALLPLRRLFRPPPPLLTAKAVVRTEVSLREFCGGPSRTVTDLSASYPVLPCQYNFTITPHSLLHYLWVHQRPQIHIGKCPPKQEKSIGTLDSHRPSTGERRPGGMIITSRTQYQFIYHKSYTYPTDIELRRPQRKAFVHPQKLWYSTCVISNR